MTTLSKEIIESVAAKYDFSEFSSEFKTSTEELYKFVAELESIAITDLVAENERLKDAQFKRLECEAEKRMKLRTALAAAEADNERLRKALDKILTTDWVSDRVRSTAKTALAQPQDDSALREMIAGVYEECAKGCRKEAVVIVVDGPEERAYNNAISDCELAIRALAEKARHGS